MEITGQMTVTSNLFLSIAAQMDSRINAAFDHTAQTCIAAADPLTRVDTGNLVSNKTIEKGSDSLRLTWNADYAGFQNDGTVHMSGTHFANRGFDAASPVLVADLGKVFS